MTQLTTRRDESKGLHILGLSAFFHDSAAAIVRDGKLIAAAQEERFSRRKNDSSYPARSVEYCVRAAGLSSVGEVDLICFYDFPLLKFDRILDTFLHCAPNGYEQFRDSIPAWLMQKLWVAREIRARHRWSGPVVSCSHHESHAASAFFPSPFESATIVTLDGVGEWTTSSWGLGEGSRIQMRQEVVFPHSLGLLYSAFTYFLGFIVNRDEYKVMGLAPYGRPKYVARILDELIDLKPDGSCRLHLKYFDFLAGRRMTSDLFEQLFEMKRRPPGAPLTSEHLDLAASIQVVTEEMVRRVTAHAIRQTGIRRVCLAGGVALNCVANGKLLSEGVCDALWIQPAAGDAGGAVGAAFVGLYEYFGHKRRLTGDGRDAQEASLLGPSYTAENIRRFLDANEYRYREFSTFEEVCDHTAGLIADHRVVGWLQGRMEFGPRALGSRSILADARAADMQSLLNLKIKRRESFRPFAPAVLREDAADYFELRGDSEYMAVVAPVRESRRLPPVPSALSGLALLRESHSTIPAVTHVDYSARIQTVAQDRNPAFHQLLSAFKARTGCPVVVNTSFNGRDEPIVASPRDAYRCFHRTQMDALVMERFVLLREDQPPAAAPTSLTIGDSFKDVFAIFVLGGSTSVGVPYGPELDFGKIVAHAFNGRIAGKPVRVVNLAMDGATASDVLKQVRRVPAAASLILVYSGHNEFLLHALRGRGRPWLVHAPDDRWRKRVVEQYGHTLEAIVTHARSIGVPIVLSTAACNQSDWPPNASVIRERRNRARVIEALRQAERCDSRGDLAAAREVLEGVLAVEPDCAAAHWWMGTYLRRMGRCDEAQRHFQMAIDFDARPTRASSEENAAVRRVCAAHQVALVDYERLLAERLGAGVLLGYNAFVDNCHPTLESLTTLAEGFCQAIAETVQSGDDYETLPAACLARAFDIDRDRRIFALASCVHYVLAATFLYTCHPITQPAAARITALADDLRAIDAAHPETLACRGISKAIAGDAEGFAACVASARLAAHATPTDWTSGLYDLGSLEIRESLIKLGMADALRQLGLPVPTALELLMDRVLTALNPFMNLLSRATVWSVYHAIVVPLGMVARTFGATRIAANVDRGASSYWTTFGAQGIRVETRWHDRWRHTAAILFFARRRRFAIAVLACVLFSSSLLLVEGLKVLMPFIYTLF